MESGRVACQPILRNKGRSWLLLFRIFADFADGATPLPVAKPARVCLVCCVAALPRVSSRERCVLSWAELVLHFIYLM